MSKTMNILGFAGSLRKASYNRSLLRLAATLVPENVKLEIYDLEGIPVFNQDFESQPPEKVKEFKMKIRMAEALLIATPEYNYSISGILKNAMDWASRPPNDNVFYGKPVAIMGASTGMMGTGRAQYHLRQCFVTLNMHPINKPEVMITYAKEKFDEKGNLNDERSKELVSQLLKNLVAWSKQLQK